VRDKKGDFFWGIDKYRERLSHDKFKLSNFQIFILNVNIAVILIFECIKIANTFINISIIRYFNRRISF